MANPESNPRFTVIIPTKDRAAYLYHTLRTCALQEYDNLEIIVSDDGSTDDTRAVVEEAARKDPRIKYSTPRIAGMLGNFEHALDQVKPGYVIALGGDDGLMPYGIQGMRDALREMKQDALAWPTPVYFYAKSRVETPQMVLITERGRLRKGRRIVSSQSFLERQARVLSYVWDVESPMFYVKGVVSTALVDRVRARSNGRFYSCSTPDGYSGVVLAGEMETYAFSGVPFSVHGISPSSAGFGYLANTDASKKQSEAFFKSAAGIPMHRELGSQQYSPLITVMTADYLLTAADLPGWPGPKPVIDFRGLLRKSVAELQDGLFASEKVARELGILYGIAKHHRLTGYLRDVVNKARRNARKPLERNAFSPSRVYLDADQFGIRNVFDAAYFAYNLHALSAEATASTVWRAFKNSVGYRLMSMKEGTPFPPESEWITDRGSTG